MKKTKLFAMMSIILAMGLAACGGNKSSQEPAKSSSEPAPSSQVQPSSEPSTPSTSAPTPSTSAPTPSSSSSARPSSSSQPSSSTQPSSSSVAPDSSSSQPASSSEVPPEPQKAVAVTSVNLVAKESKVYLQLAGTATAYTSAEFKWALALQHAGNAGAGDAKDTFILGTSATFADEDYKLDATLNDDGSYLFEYNLSTIEGIEAGIFTIHAGVKGLEANLDVGQENNGATLKDGTFRFYMRSDVGNKNSIAVDELPPVTVTEVSIVEENGKAWAKIGGVADESITQAMLDEFDSFVQFQQVGGSWTNTRRYKAGTYTITVSGGWGQPSHEEELVVEEDQFYWKLEGNKAFLYADISFFAANSNYNTHMNARHPEQADLKMEVALDEHYTMTNADGKKLDVNVVAVPGASQQADFWGNLGFKCTNWVDPNAHVHGNITLGNPVEETGKTTYATGTCDCGKKVVKWAVDSVVEGEPNKRPFKFSANDKYALYTFNYTGTLTGKLFFLTGVDSYSQNSSYGLFYNSNPNLEIEVNGVTATITNTDSYADCGVKDGSDSDITKAAMMEVCAASLKDGENTIKVTRKASRSATIWDLFIIED